MKRNLWPVLGTGVSSLVVACGVLSGALTDAENRSVLADVSGETWQTPSSPEGADGNAQTSNVPPPPECHGNPVREHCAADVTAFCADLAPNDDEVPRESRCGQTFDDRRAKREALMDCLKENLASLSAECQDVVNHAPPKPGVDERQANDGDRSKNRPPRRSPVDCGGQSRLKECIADARNLCEAELPIPGEPDGFTPEERKTRVDAIVACLRGQADSVSSACKTALDVMPAQQ